MAREIVDNRYVGNELAIFEKAVNWKSYFGKFISKYLTGHVLEIGAGIGGTTKSLCNGTQQEWICLEPDTTQHLHIQQLIQNGQLPACCIAKCGYLKDIDKGKKFDAILYLDVIEHIEHDLAEIGMAAEYLNTGGVIIILAPAHNFLFSTFDASIGHYRRYSKSALRFLKPDGFKIKRIISLDLMGFFSLLFNKLFLNQKIPTIQQVTFWDKILIPISKILDSLFFFKIGKSYLLIIRRND